MCANNGTMSDIDRLFSDSGNDVTLKQLLSLDEALDQLRRWQMLDFPTLQLLLDFLTRGDVGMCTRVWSPWLSV